MYDVLFLQNLESIFLIYILHLSLCFCIEFTVSDLFRL